MVLNDRDTDLVARNAILLLICFVEQNPLVAAEYAIHLWYSVFITEPCNNFLQHKLRPMVADVCKKIVQKPSSALLGKIWSFGNSSLRLVLTRDIWFSLLLYFDIPLGMTKEVAQLVRQRVVSAPERIDYLHRKLCLQSPPGRLSMTKFRNEGILLPFSQSRRNFTAVNPYGPQLVRRGMHL